MRSVLVVFYQYHPRVNNHYLTQSELFFKYALNWPVDRFYILDEGWSKFPNDPRITILKQDNMLHWAALPYLVNHSEGDILFVDADMLVYDPKQIELGFSKLDNHDCAAILDNSGGHDLFPANELRDIRRRIAPYLCFIKREVLTSTSMDFDPVNGEFDSMGRVSKELVEKNFSLFEFPDDRRTLRLFPDGSITRGQWLDTPNFRWSQPDFMPQGYGYYHVRNSSLGLSLINEHHTNEASFESRRSITPYPEIMRQIAWQWMYDKFTGHLDEWWWHNFNTVTHCGATFSQWMEYTNQFEEYHPWLLL